MGSAPGPTPEVTAAGVDYRGRRLGLPEHGRGSVAGFGPRLAALLIDLVASFLVGAAITALAGVRTPANRCAASSGVNHLALCPGVAHALLERNLIATGAFVGLVSLLLATSGRTLGMRARHLQVVRLDGRPLGLRALGRTVLLALLIPALITTRDGQGLHDRATGTITVHTR